MLLATLPPLYKAVFLERRNRFIASIEIENKIVDAHVPSTGRLRELLFQGAEIYVEKNNDSKRKTKHSVRLVIHNNVVIDIFASKANGYFRAIIEKKLFLPEFHKTRKELTIRNEWPYKRHKFDLFLSDGNTKTVIEVKSVNLVVNGTAMFPDAPTSRGASHLDTLVELLNGGYKGMVVFVVMRNDAGSFAFNREKDPAFYKSALNARKNGVKFSAFTLQVSLEGVSFGSELPISWD